MNSYKSGLFAEWLARMYLCLHGFRIIKSRYVTGRNTGRAEVDIIARKHNLLIFVEVKSRPDMVTGWNAITPQQTQRLRHAAETYITRYAWRGDARFDVILVCGMRIYWARGAI